MSQVQSIGDALPSASVTTNTGSFDLAEYASKPLLLYFYPKDNTPGCTIESQDFRDLYSEFQNRGAEIFGVSRDSIKSHQNFCDKFALPFPLISDADESLCNAFGVIKQMKNYGKEYIGIERSSFLFDCQGKLAQQWRKVKVAGHASLVLEALKQLDE